MEHNENSTPDDGSQAGSGVPGSGAARVSAGQLVREAREKAGIPAAKVSADLRIAPATLTALEAGDYSKLAGPPYVRAMLVSLSRYLRIDTRDVLQAYSQEAGEQEPAVATVSPYKDDSGTHAKAHKQIFILLLAVLLFVLLLIMGKVNTSAPEPEPAEPPAAADTLLNIEPPVDTTFADSLSDTLSLVDSAAAAGAGASGAGSAADTAEVETPENTDTRARIIALSDSVWLRVLPAGNRESSLYLRLDRPVDFTHEDAITFITRNGGTVRVIAGDREEVPQNRRFKVDGEQITQ